MVIRQVFILSYFRLLDPEQHLDCCTGQEVTSLSNIITATCLSHLFSHRVVDERFTNTRNDYQGRQMPFCDNGKCSTLPTNPL